MGGRWDHPRPPPAKEERNAREELLLAFELEEVASGKRKAKRAPPNPPEKRNRNREKTAGWELSYLEKTVRKEKYCVINKARSRHAILPRAGRARTQAERKESISSVSTRSASAMGGGGEKRDGDQPIQESK
mmetsp:Transcript_22293/g.55165  ORF Transcript_22293/g.55165 Transcript_22293/m.55165 type:complete len:132 (+) Transcript_22293:142-537(+)